MGQASLKFCGMLLMLQCFWTSTHCFDQVCYLPAQTSPEALPLATVNVSLCSHIIMGFAAVGQDFRVDLDPVGGQEGLAFLAHLRKHRQTMKLMLSVGGGDSFKEMVSSAPHRQRYDNPKVHQSFYDKKVCALLQDGAKREYDAESMVPYLHKEKLWVSYDDQESVALKTTSILGNGYGGTMTFSVSSDDWAGKCGNGSFPLQRVIAHLGTGNNSVHLDQDSLKRSHHNNFLAAECNTCV